MPGYAELALHVGGQAMTVEIMEMHVERLEPAKHRAADPARGDGADMHALDVIGSAGAIGDVPATLHHPIVRRQVISNQAENHHHYMLGDAD